MDELFDLMIVGSGPAGLTAAIYAGRAKLKTVLLEKETVGGQPINTELIENYPGYEKGISGAELSSRMLSQVTGVGVALELTEVKAVELNADKTINLVTSMGRFRGRALLNAGGAKPKKLGIPGEDNFAGKGVIYCAFCDGGQFADREVAVAGGGDSAITEALMLSKLAAKITVIELMPKLGCSSILQERAQQNSKIDVKCGLQIETICGDDIVRAIDLCDTATGEKSTLAVSGLLVSVGRQPNTAYLGNAVPLDKEGQIVVNEYMETAVAGLYAAGDVRSKSPRQISTAVGDGAAAGLSIIRYLQRTSTSSFGQIEL